MKDQYFGDVNDYLKYGLLRCLVDAGFRIGVCWMLTLADGPWRRRQDWYLSQPALWRQQQPPSGNPTSKVLDHACQGIRGGSSRGLVFAAPQHVETLALPARPFRDLGWNALGLHSLNRFESLELGQNRAGVGTLRLRVGG